MLPDVSLIVTIICETSAGHSGTDEVPFQLVLLLPGLVNCRAGIKKTRFYNKKLGF